MCVRVQCLPISAQALEHIGQLNKQGFFYFYFLFSLKQNMRSTEVQEHKYGI